MMINPKQFADCVPQYERLIVTICFKFTKNYFDAEDLAQETFLSAYNHLDKFDGMNLKAWLTTIAANKCRDYLKSPSRKTESLSDEDLEILAAPSDNPQIEAEKNELTAQIRKICEKLKEPYKTIALCYFAKIKSFRKYRGIPVKI